MAAFSKDKLTKELAATCGINKDTVGELLNALAKVAYREAKGGFVLPGFGEFKVELGPEKIIDNPFTGEPYSVPRQLQVSFNVDDTAMEQFVGDASDHKLLKKSPKKKKKKTRKPVIRPMVSEKVNFGGEPSWIHNAEQFQCCGQEMSFYGQIHTDALGEEYMIYDCGIIYLFLCEGCKKTRTTVQFY